MILLTNYISIIKTATSLTNVTKRWYRMKYTATRGASVSRVRSMVSSITSTHASWVRIWNMDMNAYKKEKKKMKRKSKEI
jgi:hypothetical protein